MSDVYVTQEKVNELSLRMTRLGVLEKDLVEKFVLGSGKGGQKINKTASCVYLRHVPTGIEIKCQRERSQAVNRFVARRELCDRIEERTMGEASRRRMAEERIRRQKRRRSRRQKQRMLEAKHKQGDKKRLRDRVGTEAD